MQNGQQILVTPAAPSGLPDCADWVGGSVHARRVRSEITTASISARPVLIVGEDGSGRRLAAELIHSMGPAAAASPGSGFVSIEAVNVPPGKLVSQVETIAKTGYGDGAGARPRTVYLRGTDRIGPADLSSLRKMLQTRLPFRVIRSIAPPNSNSRKERGQTIWDSEPPEVSTIRIPPLRERKMDISTLALRFLTEACERAGVGPYGLSNRMIAAYHDYDWPGNAAELKAVIVSAVSTAALARFRGRVLPDSFCVVSFNGDRTGRSLKEMIRDMEKNILESTLHRVGGNQTHAARILQLNTTTLHEKLKRHGLLSSRKLKQGPGQRPDDCRT